MKKMKFTENILGALCIIGAMGCEEGGMNRSDSPSKTDVDPGEFIEPTPDANAPTTGESD
jgi:hypothetical protein